jgi:hypothetical protein
MRQGPLSKGSKWLEGDWLDRFGGLLGGKGAGASGRWRFPAGCRLPATRTRPRARARPAPARCGASRAFNLHALPAADLSAIRRSPIKSARVDLARLRPRHWRRHQRGCQTPDPEVRATAGQGGTGRCSSRGSPAAGQPRRLERDRNRVHGYHDDLRRSSLKRRCRRRRLDERYQWTPATCSMKDDRLPLNASPPRGTNGIERRRKANTNHAQRDS